MRGVLVRLFVVELSREIENDVHSLLDALDGRPGHLHIVESVCKVYRSGLAGVAMAVDDGGVDCRVVSVDFHAVG